MRCRITKAIWGWLMGPLTTHEKLRYQREKFLALKGQYLYIEAPDFSAISRQLAEIMIVVSKIPHSDEQKDLMNEMLDSYDMMLKIIQTQHMETL